MTETETQNYLQTVVDSPDYSDAILKAACVTEHFDPTEAGAFFYEDDTDQLVWQSMVTPLVFAFGEEQDLERVRRGVEEYRQDITDLFREVAGAQTICFQRGGRFRVLPFKASPILQLVGHFPLVNRFCVFPTEKVVSSQMTSTKRPKYSQMIRDGEEYFLAIINPKVLTD